MINNPKPQIISDFTLTAIVGWMTTIVTTDLPNARQHVGVSNPKVKLT